MSTCSSIKSLTLLLETPVITDPFGGKIYSSIQTVQDDLFGLFRKVILDKNSFSKEICKIQSDFIPIRTLYEQDKKSSKLHYLIQIRLCSLINYLDNLTDNYISNFLDDLSTSPHDPNYRFLQGTPSTDDLTPIEEDLYKQHPIPPKIAHPPEKKPLPDQYISYNEYLQMKLAPSPSL